MNEFFCDAKCGRPCPELGKPECVHDRAHPNFWCSARCRDLQRPMSPRPLTRTPHRAVLEERVGAGWPDWKFVGTPGVVSIRAMCLTTLAVGARCYTDVVSADGSTRESRALTCLDRACPGYHFA